MKIKYCDIPQIVSPPYNVEVSMRDIPHQLSRYKEHYGLEVNPDFQRGHVWSRKQQEAFMEFLLRGGRCPYPLLFNCPDWMGNTSLDRPMVVVDGLQRITAITAFFSNNIKAFGYYCDDIEGVRSSSRPYIAIGVYSFTNRVDVLNTYLSLNAGGTPHSKKEIERVQELLRIELDKVKMGAVKSEGKL